LDKKILDELGLAKINKFKKGIRAYMTNHAQDLIAELGTAKELTPAMTERLDKLFAQYIQQIEQE